MTRTLTWDFLFVSVLLAGLAFVAVDVYFGDSGLDEKAELRRERAQLQAELRSLRAERNLLKKRTDALIGPEVDRDLLDERLRARQGLGREDEVLLIPPER